MTNALIVDDEAPIRLLISQILQTKSHCCELVECAEDAREILARQSFDLMLCDINMPGESGLDLARFVMEKHPDMAVLMVTAIDDHMVAESMVEIGVYDYITKPIDRNRLLISVSNALHRLKLERANRRHQEQLESAVEERTRTLQETLEALRRSRDGIIQAVTQIVEARDPYTAGHQRRVAELARAIGEEMSMPEEGLEGIYMAGLIHDLGKIAVPPEILSKPSRLSEIEYRLIQEHPQVGYDILRDIEFPWPIAEIAFQHHERIDGSGYPQGLTGQNMIFEAKILSVADVVEAMASHRPYRPGLGIQPALDEIERNAGTRYDEVVAAACIRLFAEDRFHFPNAK